MLIAVAPPVADAPDREGPPSLVGRVELDRAQQIADRVLDLRARPRELQEAAPGVGEPRLGERRARSAADFGLAAASV